MADVLSHKEPMSLQNTTELHDGALKELCFSRQGHSSRGPKVGLVRAAEGQQLTCVASKVQSEMKRLARQCSCNW